MDGPILITGSEGLVGGALRAALATLGAEVRGLDVRASRGEAGDVRDAWCVRDAVAGCRGIVHLAAVSRVMWTERDPQGCRDVNVGGLSNVIEAAVVSPRRPWLLFASSREVYGQADQLPVTEAAPMRPVNVYGRCKMAGERLVETAGTGGLRAATVRLSSVYGSTRDYPDRVLPAFAHAAVRGTTLRVEGADNAFDFTHLDDTVRGLAAIIELLSGGETPPPPIHLVTGRPTTLGELAALAVQLAGTEASIVRVPERRFDVSRFYEDPGRARKLLGWSARIRMREGLARLVRDFRREETKEVPP